MEFSDYFLSLNFSLKELGFNPGAQPGKIDSIEKQLDITFPGEYKDFLLLSNGQSSTGMIFLPNKMRILPLQSVLLSWEKEMESLYSRYDSFIKEQYEELSEDKKSRTILFHPKRIPFASNGSSGIMFIDLIPGPAGKEGQVIFTCSKCKMAILADSLGSLFSNYVKLLKEKKLIFDDKKMQLVTADHNSLTSENIIHLFCGQ